MMDKELINALHSRKVYISIVFLFLVALFTYALYHHDTTVQVTGNVIKTLAGT